MQTSKQERRGGGRSPGGELAWSLCLANRKRNGNADTEINYVSKTGDWKVFTETFKHAVGDKNSAAFMCAKLNSSNQRAIKNVDSFQFIGLDIDSGNLLEETKLTLIDEGKAAFLYTTHGHRKKKYNKRGEQTADEADRFRIIFLLSEPISRSQYGDRINEINGFIIKYIADMYGLKPNLDTSALDVSRLWYLPRVASTEDLQIADTLIVNGPPIDVAEILDLYEEEISGRANEGESASSGNSEEFTHRVEQPPPQILVFEPVSGTRIPLIEWAVKFAPFCKLDELIKASDVATKRDLNPVPHKAQVVCPWHEEHSEETAHSCYVEGYEYKPDYRQPGAFVRCGHNHVELRERMKWGDRIDRLQYLAAWLERGDLTSELFAEQAFYDADQLEELILPH